MPGDARDPHVIHVEESNALSAPLRECSQSGDFLCLVLSDGRRVWVTPNSELCELAQILSDDTFEEQLTRAANDYVHGRGIVLEGGQRVEDIARETVAAKGFADAMEQALRDTRGKNGHVLSHSERPS